MALRICTYNCCSLMKNIDVVRDLANNRYDLIFLQETMLPENRIGDLAFIDDNYEVVGIPAVYSEKALESCAGRCEGGVACMWSREANFQIDKIILRKHFLIMSILCDGVLIVVVNVYIKSDLWKIGTLNEYLECLSELESILMEIRFNSIYFIGDFNADPFSGRSWNHVTTFMERNELVCYDVDVLDNSTFTFLSYGNSYTKWLDHLIGKDCGKTRVSNIRVLNGLLGSDHFPLEFVLAIEGDSHTVNKVKVMNNTHVGWDKLKRDEIKDIEGNVIASVERFLEFEAMDCCLLGCNNSIHIQQLRKFYSDLSISVNNEASLYAREIRKKCKHKVIPGWNRRVKALHEQAREDFLLWVNLGRLRDSSEFIAMKESRKKFKDELNDCKLHECQERSISVQHKFENKDMISFWKDVQIKNNKAKHSGIIDGKSENGDIINIFNQKNLHFNSDNQTVEPEERFISKFKEYWASTTRRNLKISPFTLRRLIQKLSNGVGHDGIHTVLLKEASDEFLNILSKFMMACYMYCCVPIDILNRDINPTIKDPKGNMTESSNYRPVMQSSCLLKLFEMHVMENIEENLDFNMRQFGFRKGASTTDACYIMKETINLYTKKGGKAFGLFVDLSKAFDTVDHFMLGDILLKRNIPPDIISFLMFYLTR